jgi:DNA invertase Pin-like site-specific DNA recombinase
VINNFFLFSCDKDCKRCNTYDDLSILKDLTKHGIHFIDLAVPMPSISDSAQANPMRKMIQGFLLHMAEFETEQRKFRQQEGIKRAKEAGRYKGRKSKLTPELLKRVKKFLNINQLKIYEIARTLSVSQTTLRKVI